MKFTIVGPNKVESDQGFGIWLQNPFQLHYYECGKEVIVPGEMLSGATELLVSVSTVRRWITPNETEFIDAPKREQIQANIASALRFMGIEPEFD